MAETSAPDELAQSARFVFRGNVQRVRASLLAEVASSDQTCVVRVDEVLQAPQSLAQAAGQRLTVLLPEGASARRGEEAIFFTNPWLYGDTLAVQAVGKEAVPQTLAALSRASGDPARTLTQRDRVARIEGADLVVRGVVVSVRLPGDVAADATNVRRNEHDPMWQEAVVRVTAVEKGTGPGAEVIVRFPGSVDVAWRSAPKFQPGQEGRFILRREQAGSSGESYYTALQRYDFQPSSELLNEDLGSVAPSQ